MKDLYQGKDRPIEIREELAKKDTEELGPDILRDEVITAINEMKNNKTEGIDSIQAEVFKCFREKAVNELIELCQDIYRSGNWPEDFLQTIMIPLRKPNAATCEEYRTISLLTLASKILLK